MRSGCLVRGRERGRGGGGEAARGRALVHVEEGVDAVLRAKAHDELELVQVRLVVPAARGLEPGPEDTEPQDVQPEPLHPLKVLPGHGDVGAEAVAVGHVRRALGDRGGAVEEPLAAALGSTNTWWAPWRCRSVIGASAEAAWGSSSSSAAASSRGRGSLGIMRVSEPDGGQR